MREFEFAEKTLSEMLKSLGFEAEILGDPEKFLLEIESPSAKTLIGNKGDRLDDLQYLVNRIVIEHFPDCPKIRIDCEKYRENEEAKLRNEVRKAASRVREDGRPLHLQPMNAYYRKLAYDTLAEEPGVKASSPLSKERFKRILIEPA